MLAAKAFLAEPNGEGVSLASHLTELLSELLQHEQLDALAALEAVSLSLKGKHFTPHSAAAELCPTLEPEVGESAWHAAANALLKVDPAAEPEEAGDLVSPNLVEVMDLFSIAGLGLSKEETYRLHVSLYKLQKEKELSTIRFFGKVRLPMRSPFLATRAHSFPSRKQVLGTEADYYIAEASHPASGDEEEPLPEGPVPTEEKGSGCNAFTYFVCNDPAGSWTELPVVTPQQLVASVRIRKFFTGKLDAPVRAYPPFPGKEKEYLRAQIARISAATILCPAGKYKLEEEDSFNVVEVEEDDEDFKPLAAAAVRPSAPAHPAPSRLLDP